MLILDKSPRAEEDWRRPQLDIEEGVNLVLVGRVSRILSLTANSLNQEGELLTAGRPSSQVGTERSNLRLKGTLVNFDQPITEVRDIFQLSNQLCLTTSISED